MLGQQLASLRLTLEKIFFTSNYVLLVLFLAPVVTILPTASKIRAQINQIFHTLGSYNFAPSRESDPSHQPEGARKRFAAKITPAQVAGTSNLKYLK